MKLPIYIMINSFFISCNIVLGLKFIFKRPHNRNLPLYDEQKTNAVLFVIISVLYCAALSLWAASPMDEKAWEYPAQQVFYIAAENILAILIFIKLYFYNFPRRRK